MKLRTRPSSSPKTIFSQAVRSRSTAACASDGRPAEDTTMQIESTRAIITGGASGLGLAVAEMLVAAGAKVALFDVNDTAGVAVVQKLGTAASFHKVDVTSEPAVTSAVAAATSAMGGLTAAIMCAGIGSPRKLVGKD